MFNRNAYIMNCKKCYIFQEIHLFLPLFLFMKGISLWFFNFDCYGILSLSLLNQLCSSCLLLFHCSFSFYWLTFSFPFLSKWLDWIWRDHDQAKINNKADKTWKEQKLPQHVELERDFLLLGYILLFNVCQINW
jgi:hypothetical protein